MNRVLVLVLWGGLLSVTAFAQRPNQRLTPGEIRTTSRAEICAPAFRTGSLRKTSYATKLRMCTEYGMPWHCWGPARLKMSAMNSATHDIFAVGDSFKMGRVDAVGNTATMVQLGFLWDGPSQYDPEQNVSADTLNRDISNRETRSAIAARLHSSTDPQPATRRFVKFDLAQDGLLNRVDHAMLSPTGARAINGLPLGDELDAASDAVSGLGPLVVMRFPAQSSTVPTLSMSLAYKGNPAAITDEIEGHGQKYTKTKNPCLAGCEADHLISLELGGADELLNLWPEPYPSAFVKDRLENELHRKVCNGEMPLPAAQKCIAKNWIQCYQKVFHKKP